jgi:hypothetical protein
MIASRREFLAGFGSLLAAPAIVRADSLMKLHHIPERYATVWGVGHDYEVIELALWKPTLAIEFGISEHMYKFREVTDWVYSAPVGTLYRPLPRVNPTQAYFEEERRKLAEWGQDSVFTWADYDLNEAEKQFAARKISRELAAAYGKIGVCDGTTFVHKLNIVT